MRSQSDALQENWDWIIICDAGRADAFKDIYPMFFEGNYETVYNGGHTATVTWFPYHFSGKYEHTLFHGGVPVHSYKFNPFNYDEREHFRDVVPWEEFDWDETRETCTPETVIDMVRDSNCEKGVVRFLQPHTPYRNLGRIHGIGDASKYCHEDLKVAYYDNYRWVLEMIRYNLLPELSGRVAITSDHGECLGDCGHYLHSPKHEEHDHLIHVPFLEVTGYDESMSAFQ